VETYFTFPDASLAYDCGTCRQRCCRGKGFSFSAEELVPLLRRAPHLAPHLQLRGGGSFGGVDLTERCWFLKDDGLCDLEVREGRDAKPSTCRLFPFNRVYKLGEVRIVDVNSMLCPVDPAPGRGQTWAGLQADLEALAGSSLLDVPAWQPLDLAPDWLARERAIAAVAGEHFAKNMNDPDKLASEAGDRETGPLRAAWARAYGIAEGELSALEALAAPRVALLYPSLRWNALFRKHAPSYPKAVAELPRRLRALTFIAGLAARSLGGPPSLRGITELYRAQADAIDVLCAFTAPVKLTDPRFEADIPPQLQGALGVLLGGAMRGGKTLGQLVEAAASTLPVEQRPLAVALAARQLDRLVP
jgi:Fe-S-cluster containining protein